MKNLSGNTPLHSAVETGQKEIVEYLIQNKVHVREVNIFGQTPIAIAKVLGKHEIFELLKHADHRVEI